MQENQNRDPTSKSHPTVREHPEQRRQEETGREDASEAGEVGRPPSEEPQTNRQQRTA